MSFKISNIFKKKQPKETRIVDNPVNLFFDGESKLSNLPDYKISAKKPRSLFNKRNYIQVVLVSEILPPKFFWAEWDGILLRTENRAYKPPRDIRGNVFFWHIDRKESLVDIAKADNKTAENSFHELQIFNMAYSIGRQAGMNDWTKKVGLILLVCGLLVLLAIGNLYYTHSNADEVIKQTQYYGELMRNYTMTHP